MTKISILTYLLFSSLIVIGQDYRWQQRAEYEMDVKLDVSNHHLTGSQKLTYHNNSGDTLTKVYYHLYFNAFQPGSMMDVRSRNIVDPDSRIGARIVALKEDEIGYQHIKSLKQDGKTIGYTIEGTVMEVVLSKPILPHTKSVLEMEFESQVPVQIRRSGRNNKEGIAYTMTQWYPKLAEYDFRGWHPNQYVAREFHGVWADFDVKITLDPAFVVAGTGVLQNANRIGYGYEEPGENIKRRDGDLTWNFRATNVTDFAWAADAEFVHDKAEVPDGPVLHFFYQPGDNTTNNWKKMQSYAVSHFEYMHRTIGKYPYETYSVIQGGDGGMEYPMCTMITGERSFGSLIGVVAHESAHSWFQGILASNEFLYPWLDEGFADFTSQESMAELFKNQIETSHDGSYASYFNLIARGIQEPMSVSGDYYLTTRAYNTAAYSMGTIFLNQLKYIIGNEKFYTGMRQYYQTWKFRHPEPNDFIRIMEKISGLQLKWYQNYWVNTTKQIDYGIKSFVDSQGSTFITLERIGEIPMPIDLVITYADGAKELYYIPTNETLGNKPVEDTAIHRLDLEAWPWVYPTYTLKVNRHASEIKLVQIDPSKRMADVDPSNNTLDLTLAIRAFEHPTR